MSAIGALLLANHADIEINLARKIWQDGIGPNPIAQQEKDVRSSTASFLCRLWAPTLVHIWDGIDDINTRLEDRSRLRSHNAHLET